MFESLYSNCDAFYLPLLHAIPHEVQGTEHNNYQVPMNAALACLQPIFMHSVITSKVRRLHSMHSNYDFFMKLAIYSFFRISETNS